MVFSSQKHGVSISNYHQNSNPKSMTTEHPVLLHPGPDSWLFPQRPSESVPCFDHREDRDPVGFTAGPRVPMNSSWCFFYEKLLFFVFILFILELFCRLLFAPLKKNFFVETTNGNPIYSAYPLGIRARFTQFAGRYPVKTVTMLHFTMGTNSLF